MPKPAATAIPVDALTALAQLGQRLRAHRVHQAQTVVDMAQRLMCSPTTYRALEAGKPGTSMGVLVQALWMMGQLDSLDHVALAPTGWATGRRVRRSPGQSAPGRISEAERDF